MSRRDNWSGRQLRRLFTAPAVILVSVLAREVPQVASSVQQASLPASDQVERLWLMAREQPAQAYITAPVTTLGQLCSWSTYVTVVQVEKVSKETFPELGAIAADIEAGRPVALATVIQHPDPDKLGRRLVVRPPSPVEPVETPDGERDRV